MPPTSGADIASLIVFLPNNPIFLPESNAKDAALKADLKAIYTEYVAQAAEDGLEVEEEVVIEITDTDGAKYYKVSNGQLVSELEEPVCDAKVYGDNIYFADHLDGDDDNTDCDRTGCPAA